MSAALGACGVLLVAQGQAPRLPTAASAAQQLRVQAIYDRLEPAVVDVTSVLRYDAETAQGTGFVINAADGLILTNNHVIRDATTVTVRLTSDGRQFPARIVGADVPADVALLQVPHIPRLATASIGESAAVNSGAPVLSIGNKAGAGGAPTSAPGVIIGLGETIQANDASSAFTETLHDMLQTSAHIAPGDSGGPLADAEGQVIGMVTAAGNGPAGLVGYAIPIGDALAAARLIVGGHHAPGVFTGTGGFLGVVAPATTERDPRRQATSRASLAPPFPAASRLPCVQTPPAAAMPAKVAPARSGALVFGVLCGTSAAAAGLAPGDVITSVNGRPVTSPDALTAIVSACRPGSLIPVTWISPAGQRRTRLVRLAAAPAA